MGKHDEIVLRLTNEKITKILIEQFYGEEGIYLKEDQCFIKINEKTFPYIKRDDKTYVYSNELQENFKILKKLKERDDNLLIIEKTIEFPLIKGEFQYKVTKGFIDLIVWGIQKKGEEMRISPFAKEDIIEFIIEIKTESDFKDFGAILRQIKEYREYYNCTCKNWAPKGHHPRDTRSRAYCILSTKIPEEIKKLFSSENILCLELDKD